MQDLNKKLGAYLSNLCALERCLFETVQMQIQDEQVIGHTKSGILLGKLLSVHKTHLETLEEMIAKNGDFGRSLIAKEAVAAITGTLAGAAEIFRTARLSRLLRDDYTALSYAAMTYTMLHTAALAAANAPIADLALRHLRELTPLIVQLSTILPEAVLYELKDPSGKLDKGVARAALENTHRAWSPEVLSTAED